jgi:hypothetical protein
MGRDTIVVQLDPDLTNDRRLRGAAGAGAPPAAVTPSAPTVTPAQLTATLHPFEGLAEWECRHQP